MQTVLNRWNTLRSTAVPTELIGHIASTRTEGLNLHGVFSFPIEVYSSQLLPSLHRDLRAARGAFLSLCSNFSNYRSGDERQTFPLSCWRDAASVRALASIPRLLC
jgi:hypothetical protein